MALSKLGKQLFMAWSNANRMVQAGLLKDGLSDQELTQLASQTQQGPQAGQNVPAAGASFQSTPQLQPGLIGSSPGMNLLPPAPPTPRLAPRPGQIRTA